MASRQSGYKQYDSLNTIIRYMDFVIITLVLRPRSGGAAAWALACYSTNCIKCNIVSELTSKIITQITKAKHVHITQGAAAE